MSHCWANKNMRDGPAPNNIEAGAGVKTGINTDDELIIHEPVFQIVGKYDDTPPDTPRDKLPLMIIARYEAVIRVRGLESFDREDLAYFARYVGSYYVWPYWREFVESMTTRLGG